jgi:hypothetical protein
LAADDEVRGKELTMEKDLGKTQGVSPAQAGVDEEEWYDLLPVEKKLIGYSLSLGVALLVVFVVVFRVL